MYWLNRPMAIIKRPKLSGLGEHVGVLQPDGNVFHTTDGKGPEIVSYRQFAAGKPVQLVEQIPQDKHIHALTRIQHELFVQRPYDVVTNNCEIVASRVAGKQEESPQVQFWMLLATLAGFVAWARAS